MKPYTFEIIPDTEQKQAAWRLGIMNSDGGIVASTLAYSRPTAIKWAERCVSEWKFDMHAAREAIDAAFFGPEKGKAGPTKYTFAASPSAVEGFVAMAVIDEAGTSIAMSGVRDRDTAEHWAAEMTVRFPLNSSQVEEQLDAAFAALVKADPVESNPPIDAEYAVIEDGGPAFPCDANTQYHGLTMRDIFAAFALMGIVAREGVDNKNFDSDAATAYQYADAMLSERNASRCESK